MPSVSRPSHERWWEPAGNGPSDSTVTNPTADVKDLESPFHMEREVEAKVGLAPEGIPSDHG